MRISIDATGLGGPKTGTSVYLSEILSVWNRDLSIDHNFVIFATAKAKSHLADLGLDQRFSFVIVPNHRLWRVLWQQTAMAWHISRLGMDVHWGAGFVLPLLSGVPMVLTVHDLTFQLFPEVHERIKRYYFPAMIRAGVAKAGAVIAISESTRSDIHRLLPASRKKTVVTLLAGRDLGPQVSKAVSGIDMDDNRYMLFVGTVEPRKNLSRLVTAWQSLDDSDRGRTRLIVVGATGWLVEELLGHLNTADTIEFKGQVKDSELASLMQGAMAFLYPSLYEGFGLPVVEAMALGIPVLTSNVGATKEVAEGAAILVDPTSIEDIRAGVTRLLHEPGLCESLAALGKERAAAFSWERTASDTLAIIERVGQLRVM
ncbi:MAG: glycosyltransferase family 1 protein [Gammaproteobacteria bacterium]